MSSARSQLSDRSLSVATTVAAAALLLWASTAPHAPRRHPAASLPVTGTYTVAVAGFAAGTGTCSVDPGSVDIDCTLDDAVHGKTQLEAVNLKRAGNRFTGLGILDGVRTSISGRIDAGTAAHPKPTLSATFLASNNNAGRLVGPHD